MCVFVEARPHRRSPGPGFSCRLRSTAQNPPQGQIARPDPIFAAMYGPRPDEKFDLPATDITGIDTELLRQEVAYPTREQPGTIVVDTTNRFLYLVRENGRALRYGSASARKGWRGAGAPLSAERRCGRAGLRPTT